MAFLVAVIVGDLENISLLDLLLGGSSVGPRSKGTIFSSVPFGSVEFPLFVLSCLLGGLVSLLGLTGLIRGLI